MLSSYLRFALLLLVLAALCVWRLAPTQWSTSLLDALPQSSDALQQQATASDQQQLALLLRIPSSGGVSHHQWQAQVHQWVQQLIAGSRLQLSGQATLSAFNDYYAKHAGAFISASDGERVAAQNWQALADRAQQRLLSPAPLFADIVRQDPLLLSQFFLEQLPQPFAPFQRQQGVWFHDDDQQRQALVLLNSQVDAFSQQQASAQLALLEANIAEWQQRLPQLTVSRSGLLFHAVAAADRAKWEISVYGSASLALALLLMWVVFRSLRQLLVTLAILSCAAMVGLLVLVSCFQRPHVLAFVFSTTLIGLCIDYVFHGAIAWGHGAERFRQLRRPLTLSAMSTIIGFIALWWLPLPLLQQMGVFMAAGLLSVLLIVLFWLPHAIPARQPSRRWQRCCERWQRCYPTQPGVARWLAWCWPALAVISVTALLLMSNSEDNVRSLNQSPPALLKQEQQVRQAVAGLNISPSVLLVSAANLEQVLNKERIVRQLLVSQGLVQQLQGLSGWLPVTAAQQWAQQIRQQAQQHGAIADYLAWLGLSDYPSPPPLAAAEHPLAAQYVLAAPTSASRVTARSFLLGVSDSQAVTAALHELDLPGVQLYSPLQQASKALSHYRQQLKWWLAGLLTIAALVVARSMGWRQSINIVSVVALAVTLALWVSQGLQPLNLFHAIGAILVAVLGLDYGIFCSHGARHGRLGLQQAMQATGLSALTTCVAFGLLAFSQTPAIAAFGTTVLVGVLVSVICTPSLALLMQGYQQHD
ncbi:MMPL family transporter [Idiomarina xiamenensis]|uniref:RND superfamily multidrug efflux system protein n=1 Tax=Idiomarina xiamenensis 10-D-4 TaxID=740709 RepID=K2KA53_9GAMM|nr:MMPL family transporter [Idiomarina xiamenensis]EKE83422.1 RND superfamily multidrug efflux system protein [Idiomarina xiamenensis 10-D-4]